MLFATPQGRMKTRFLRSILFIFSLLTGPLASAGHDYKWVISGGGPGGLSTALFLLDAGVRPEDLLVVEKRLSESPSSAFRLNTHGSRNRTIGLEQTSYEMLSAAGVTIESSPLDFIEFQYDDESLIKKSRRLHLSAKHFRFIEGVTHRRFQSTITIGQFEKNLLATYLKRRGNIRFGTEVEFENIQNGVGATLIAADGSTERVTSRYAVIAEGKNSRNRSRIGVSMIPIENDSKQHYWSTDFAWPKDKIDAAHGGLHLFYDDSARLIAYAGISATGGSIGILIPHKNSHELLSSIANQLGVSQNLLESSNFSAELLRAERVVTGNIIAIGDAARTTDPITANGANVAVLDAKHVAEFEMARHSGQEVQALHNLKSQIEENSAWSIENSLYFQETIRWMERNSIVAKSMFRWSFPEGSLAARTLDRIVNAVFSILPGQRVRQMGQVGATVLRLPAAPNRNQRLRLRPFAPACDTLLTENASAAN